MKYILLITILLFSYITIKNTAYNVDSSYYFEYLKAESDYNQEQSRIQFCGLVWKLRDKQSIPLFTNCYKDFDTLVNAQNEKKVHKLGTSIFDYEEPYQTKIGAMFKYIYMRENKYLIAIKTFVRLEHRPKTLKAEPNFYRDCEFDGKRIIVYRKYEYGYHAPDFKNGQLLIPDALNVTDCKELKE